MKSTYKLSSRVRLDEDDDGVSGVLFDTHTAAISTCNETALVILKSLKKGSDVDSLARLVAKTFEVNEKDAKLDVVSLLRDLTTLEFVCERE